MKALDLFNISRDDISRFEPIVLSFSNDEDAKALEEIFKNPGQISICDEIHGQLEEFVKLRKPKQQSFTNEEVENLIIEHLNGKEELKFGCWVYYPWSARFVHILPEDEFIEVRTNRNRNKITLKESEVLSKKKVGIIGLSVGQSVSVTMAMERSFGEIRLADFDKLELSNLNRIRTGLHNLGLPKVISVAREILEIDPFIKIRIFPDGITEENIESFLTEGGKLDTLIDECDGLDIKVLCRIRAKAHRIPVLMEASDRGTIDVERFDLEPDRPILHGFIDHLDVSRIKDLKTNEEKIPYLLPIAGVDTLSEKMRASMLEIGQTLTTWPQLSSAVTLGGGITADTYRRMMLDEFTDSGRYFVDLDNILCNKENEKEVEKGDYINIEPIQKKDMRQLLDHVSLNGIDRTEMNEVLAKELVAAAITAPSGGNNQPWKWLHHDNALYLFHDRARSVSFSDFGDMGSMISFGACIENLRIKAKHLGFNIHEDFFPIEGEKRLICRIVLNRTEETEDLTNDLVEYIGSRHTNRNKYSEGNVDEKDLQKLQEVIHLEKGIEMQYCTDTKKIEKLSHVIAACERIRIMHPMGHHDFYQHEVRWTDEESREKADGIDLATVELTLSERAGMKLASDPHVVDYLRKWNAGRGFEKLSQEAVANSPAIGLIKVNGKQTLDYIRGGKMLQRVWLKATQQNLSIHPVSAGLFMFARLFTGKGENLNKAQQEELLALHNDFINVFPQEDGMNNLFMFRIFKSDKDVVRSYRLPINEVLTVI